MLHHNMRREESEPLCDTDVDKMDGSSAIVKHNADTATSEFDDQQMLIPGQVRQNHVLPMWIVLHKPSGRCDIATASTHESYRRLSVS